MMERDVTTSQSFDAFAVLPYYLALMRSCQ